MKSARRSAALPMSFALGVMTTVFCTMGPHSALARKAAHAQKTDTPGGEPAVAYTVTVTPTKNTELDAAMTASSQLKSLQASHAVGGYALAGRIRGDYDRVKNALESFGYYAGTITITVKANGHTLDGRDPTVPDVLRALPKGQKATITISAQTGPQFHLGTVSLTTPPPARTATPADVSAVKAGNATAGQTVSSFSSGKAGRQTTHPGGKSAQTPQGNAAPPTSQAAAAESTPVTLTPEEQKAFNLRSGQPAVAADVLAAQSNLLNHLQEEGYATATVSTPLAYLRPQTKTLDVVFRIQRGPRLVIGPIGMNGLKNTHQSYLRRRIPLHEGELYQPSRIENARQDLASTGVFSSVQANNAPPIVTLPPAESMVPGITQAMPVRFDFKESKPRTVAAEVGYSTDLGERAGVSWTHHNILGNAEQLRLTALITGLGGSAQQGLGYDFYADFLKPDFLHKGQNLSVRLEGIRQWLYSYHQTAILGRAGITRHVGRYWSLSGSLSAEQEQIQQFGTTRNYFIISAPLYANFDNTQLSNPIDPATHGVRASLSATPSESLESGSSFFAILSAQVSTYFDLAHLGLTKPGKSVIAVRGLVGSVQGASTFQIPPDQRLYAGGPSTVRGFRYQGVGPQYGHTKYGIGGTSMDAGSVEYRQRLPWNLGVAGFVDAGQVGTGSRPGEGKLRVGYGGGVRYFTPIGPVRVDVALPMNRPVGGDKWELYFGLGETF